MLVCGLEELGIRALLECGAGCNAEQHRHHSACLGWAVPVQCTVLGPL